MKSRSFYLLAFAMLIPTTSNASCGATTLIVPRSQSVNAARELAGMTNHICIYDMEKFYGTFAITPEYTRSFKEDELTKCLFGPSLTGCDAKNIRISGSTAANRGERDWLADYFGLPTDFESCLSFSPRITNFLVDFYLYLGLDEWLCGLFFFIHAPVVHTKWEINMCESIENPGTAGYETGYFAPTSVDRSVLRNSFSEFANGCTALDLGNNVTIENLKYARISCDSKSDTGLSDIRFALGWNFFQDEEYHIGLGLMGAAPTGSRPDGDYLFEPIIGNGHHWELGGMAWGHAIFWRSECEEKFLSGWLQANITHLFKTRQCRFFDLKCKPNSRYMLAERLDTPVELLLANEMEDTVDGSQVPAQQFKNLYAPVANITEQQVDVSVAVQADIVAMLSYTSCGFTWDIGYNFWARTCQDITPSCDCPPRVENQLWGLKGNAYTYGFSDAPSGGMAELDVDTPVALSATQSCATIHAGTNVASGGIAANQNAVIDNREWAVAGEDQMATDLLFNKPTTEPAGRAQTGTSKDPVIITCDQIDYDSGRTKGLSQKVFTHFSYAWLDNEDWTPYLGVGAEIEFAQDEKKCDRKDFCDLIPCPGSEQTTNCTTTSSCTSCDDCLRCTVSQWGVWIKGGFSFN